MAPPRNKKEPDTTGGEAKLRRLIEDEVASQMRAVEQESGGQGKHLTEIDDRLTRVETAIGRMGIPLD